MRHYMMILIAFAAALTASCSARAIPSCIEVAPPEIHITSQKTVIERQIVGDYRELEKDAWIISSVRTNLYAPGSDRDRELFESMAARDANSEKIRAYKDEGALGEGGDGYLHYIGTPRYQEDARRKKQLADVIQQENQARKAIFRRLLVRAGKASPSDGDIGAFGRRFAEEQRAFAKEKDYIQDNTGKWVRK